MGASPRRGRTSPLPGREDVTVAPYRWQEGCFVLKPIKGEGS